MEEWIKVIAPLIGIAGLWWKLTTSMATKAELTAVKTDLRAEIAEVKADFKEDIAGVRAEIGEVKSGMADMKADLRAENAELRADIREIRQLLYKNVVGTGGEDNNGKKT